VNENCFKIVDLLRVWVFVWLRWEHSSANIPTSYDVLIHVDRFLRKLAPQAGSSEHLVGGKK
jgi:hypothetical protein